MKNLEDQMAFYASYHQDARNKATHFLGVPAIMLSLFIPLAALRVQVGIFEITGSIVLAAVVLMYHVSLDACLALIASVFTSLLVLAGHWIWHQGSAIAWTCFGIFFVGGWLLQLVGHAYEGRKPALTDNLFQIFIAPIFLCAELAFKLGYKPELRAAAQERALRLRAGA